MDIAKPSQSKVKRNWYQFESSKKCVPHNISPNQVSWEKLSSTNYILHVSSAVARTARRPRWRRFENSPQKFLSFVSVISWMRSSTKYSESERLLLATTAIGGLELATTQRFRKIHRCSHLYHFRHLHDYYRCREHHPLTMKIRPFFLFFRLSTSWRSLSAFPLVQRSYSCLKDFNLCQYMEPNKKQKISDLSETSWFW